MTFLPAPEPVEFLDRPLCQYSQLARVDREDDQGNPMPVKVVQAWAN